MDVASGFFWIGGLALVVVIAAVLLWVFMSGKRGDRAP